jgi:hypothetical protein
MNYATKHQFEPLTASSMIPAARLQKYPELNPKPGGSLNTPTSRPPIPSIR